MFGFQFIADGATEVHYSLLDRKWLKNVSSLARNMSKRHTKTLLRREDDLAIQEQLEEIQPISRADALLVLRDTEWWFCLERTADDYLNERIGLYDTGDGIHVSFEREVVKDKQDEFGTYVVIEFEQCAEPVIAKTGEQLLVAVNKVFPPSKSYERSYRETQEINYLDHNPQDTVLDREPITLMEAAGAVYVEEILPPECLTADDDGDVEFDIRQWEQLAEYAAEQYSHGYDTPIQSVL